MTAVVFLILFLLNNNLEYTKNNSTNDQAFHYEYTTPGPKKRIPFSRPIKKSYAAFIVFYNAVLLCAGS